MDHQFRVRVLDSTANRQEYAEPLVYAEIMMAAVLVKRFAIDEFHGEVRTAIRSRSGIEQAGDVWMSETRQNLPFTAEAVERFRPAIPYRVS